MTITMDVKALEAEAKATAAKHVAITLLTPDQLEKVEQYKRRVSRKKASIEAMLKTAMQSQLDGVRNGLNHLSTSLVEIREISANLVEIEEVFQNLPALAEKLQDVKEESIKHIQYAAAMENLKHIFNVPGSVQKTQELINDGKLLQAHQALSDLENSRDDLLFELHKLPNQSPTDKNMLTQYFADVEKLSDELGKQLWLILKRTLNTVRKEPTVIVTALRIIEREERVDKATLQRKQISGFNPPGRPKQWKKKAFEVLEVAVEERIEGNQFEDRTENKMWLVRHLEVTRQIIIDDLKTVKTVCIPCFPPEYDIVNNYIHMYHKCLSSHLQNIISNELEGNEYVTILGWLNVYGSEELMGHPDLNIDIKKLGPLLSTSEVERLIDKYLRTLKTNYRDWLKNSLNSDVKDWNRNCDPDADNKGFYHTSAPMIVFQMVDQHLQVAKTVSQDLTHKVLIISLEEIVQFINRYVEAVREFKMKHFEDRSLHHYFTQYTVAIANNCIQFQKLADQLYKDYWTRGANDNDLTRVHDALKSSLKVLRDITIEYLVEELFLDLNKEIADLVTKKWLMTGSNIIDTISATIEDYNNDYTRLAETNFDFLMMEIQKHVAKGYITSILQKRISFKGYDERREASEKIIQEGSKMKNLFSRLNPTNIKRESPLDALPLLAEVLKMKDTSLLSLEISGLIKRYPDISAEHLLALLALRGDIGRIEARQLVMEMRSEDQPYVGERSIFSLISLG